jgi:intein-encoded DNA endonuclease-like protein
MTPEYAAGFFDGEGCVNCSSSRNNSFIRILVVNTNLEILQRFQAVWGGDINPNYKSKAH